MKHLAAKAAILILLAIIAFYSAVIGLLQFSLFDDMHEKKDLEAYLKETSDHSYADGKLHLTIPADVISTEFEKNAEGLWTYQPETGRLVSNATMYGFYVPLSFDLIVSEVEQKGIYFSYDNLAMGSHHWPSLGLWGRLAKANIVDPLFPYIVDLTKTDPYGLLNPEKIEKNETGLIATFTVDREKVMNLITEMRGHVSEDLANGFAVSDNISKQKAAQWMTDRKALSDEDITLLLEDAFGAKNISNYMLLLIDADTAANLTRDLPLVFGYLDTALLDSKRYELVGEAIESYADLLNGLYKGYLEDGTVIVSYGRAYSPDLGGTLGFAEAAEKENLEVPAEILEKLSVAFDPADGTPVAVYDVDGSNVILFTDEGRTEMEKENYEIRYPKIQPPEPTREIGAATWNSFEKTLKNYFQVDEVFIRYLSEDGMQAFVIASPEDDYQNYWVMTMELSADGKSWIITDDNVESLAALAESQPLFNMDLATNEFEHVRVYPLQEGDKALIIEQLIEKGYLNKGDGVSIDYCSYDGTYISFRLTSGVEYVYKVEEMYLAILLLKEAAIERWADVPDMLLLDEPTEFM